MTAALAMQMHDMQEMDGMMGGMTPRSTIRDCWIHPQPPRWRPDQNAVSISLLRNEAQPALVVRHERPTLEHQVRDERRRPSTSPSQKWPCTPPSPDP